MSWHREDYAKKWAAVSAFVSAHPTATAIAATAMIAFTLGAILL